MPPENYSERQLKVSGEIKNFAGDFFERESSGLSLITVTRVTVSRDMHYATVYITVLPESKEQAALDFARRQRPELRHYVMKRWKSKTIPFFEIEIDYGEKNRQNVNTLLRQSGTDLNAQSGSEEDTETH